MNNVSCINFTYKSPTDDISDSMGVNSDGTLNIKYTLVTLRNLLLENINIVNKLLDNSDNITDIIPINYNTIVININDNEVKKNLYENNIIVPNLESENSDTDSEEYPFMEETIEETNYERYQMINHATNHDQISSNLKIVQSDSDIESDSDMDELICDEFNIKSIVEKYKKFNSDSESDYDSLDNSYSEDNE